MKKTIKAYLDKRAQEDELFALRYANPKKNIDDCMTFVFNAVNHMANDLKCYGLHDEEVYSLILHYYDEDDIEVGQPIKCEVVVNHTIQLTDEEKAKARQEAIERVQNEAYAEIKRRQEKKAKKAQSQTSAQPTTKIVQQNLF